MPASPSLLIAGCGDVGGRLAQRLIVADWTVYGLRRDVARLPAAVLPVPGDLQADSPPAAWPQGPLDYLVYCATPAQHDEAGYRAAYVDGLRHVLAWLAAAGQCPRRLLFVSSSGVYGQQGGEWIDEDSPAEAPGYSARIMREAEQLALHSGLPATAVRLTGIYGPGRTWLLNQVRQGYRAASEPPLYGNRIHADDAAGLLAFLLQADARGVALADCYIGVDDEPAPLHEVVGWLREQLGVSHWAEESAVRRSGSKRCSNARARALGWAPHYPSYREGYAALLAADQSSLRPL
ncbi:NAD-dependent epimerase/dehydratase family protein [Pseudomonas sp. L-22-4S-12]|uniref:NAD-dependent epimerase/dehydratase family protein n=1 Tax=Pseudomonas sp. L-22-4S-12 TaxID=2610893 RepID=UPI0013280F56|nr:NAD-dependent epimerase/dehydratase family protein [Pseudomonas sp. L-22-4S-12]MWV14643.1 NAD-dependent epimerase/dehydratase family protein [Pseudomonas sp. L-22-4S-12]